jgi:hypothetical protein
MVTMVNNPKRKAFMRVFQGGWRDMAALLPEQQMAGALVVKGQRDGTVFTC